MEYRGVKIQLKEYLPGQKIEEIGGNGLALGSQLAFVASSEYGVAIATRSQRALDDVKAMIDRSLNLN